MATNPTLPGVRVTLSEGYYTANDANPDAARVLLIATPGAASPVCSAGLYSPIKYSSEQQVLTATGKGSPAHVAYVQAIRSGAANIYIACVDPSKVATVAERETELNTALGYADLIEPDIIVAYGFYANEVVPGVATDTVELTIARIDSDADTDDVTFTFATAGLTAANWAKIVVGDTLAVAGLTEVGPPDQTALNGNHVVTAKLGTASSAPRVTVSFSHTVDYDAAVAAGTATKTIASTGATLVDNAKNLGEACHRLMRDLNPCIGVIAMQPIAQDAPTATEIQTYVTAVTGAALEDLTGITMAPAANVVNAVKAVTPVGESTTVDYGRYLCLVAGKVMVKGQPDDLLTPYAPILTSCEAVVAGQIYRTELDSAITSAPLLNVIDIANNFSRAQRLALITDQINPVCLSSASTIITLDGWTLAQPDAVTGAASVYERLSTVRITNSVIKDVRNELEKFIGMQASTARLNSIETKLRTLLNGYKTAGVLRNAEFKITYSQATGTLTVDLSLVPFGEMRNVDVTVAVKINA